MKIQFLNAQELERCYLQDISRGGIFIRTDEVHPTQTVVRVTLLLPGGESIALDGRVVHVASSSSGSLVPAGMGIEFFDLKPQLAAKIEAYIAHLKVRGARVL